MYFHNYEYEDEWRIQEIYSRKGFVIFTFIIKLGGDFIWTWTPEMSLANKIQAGISDLIFLAVICKIYYRKFKCKKEGQGKILESENEEEQDEF